MENNACGLWMTRQDDMQFLRSLVWEAFGTEATEVSFKEITKAFEIVTRVTLEEWLHVQIDENVEQLLMKTIKHHLGNKSHSSERVSERSPKPKRKNARQQKRQNVAESKIKQNRKNVREESPQCIDQEWDLSDSVCPAYSTEPLWKMQIPGEPIQETVITKTHIAIQVVANRFILIYPYRKPLNIMTILCPEAGLQTEWVCLSDIASTVGVQQAMLAEQCFVQHITTKYLPEPNCAIIIRACDIIKILTKKLGIDKNTWSCVIASLRRTSWRDDDSARELSWI